MTPRATAAATSTVEVPQSLVSTPEDDGDSEGQVEALKEPHSSDSSPAKGAVSGPLDLPDNSAYNMEAVVDAPAAAASDTQAADARVGSKPVVSGNGFPYRAPPSEPTTSPNSPAQPARTAASKKTAKAAGSKAVVATGSTNMFSPTPSKSTPRKGSKTSTAAAAAAAALNQKSTEDVEAHPSEEEEERPGDEVVMEIDDDYLPVRRTLYRQDKGAQ